jgi:hypothetical protein
MLPVADAVDTHLAGLNIGGRLYRGLEMPPNQRFAQPQRGSLRCREISVARKLAGKQREDALS